MKAEFLDAISYDRAVELQPKAMAPLMMLLKLVGFGECTGITFMALCRKL
ncbi:hypothetical protein BN938_0915 [Mucinivorans hirudinis]|uniref:Uncharacterized protein n=1 Tax=Mucinivorans hirudinis TaxID=1433126 RepID=A0A060R772_9BACT|nr:hypothetical protein BN938_0915 [Mucinivorans hirudinis]